MTTVPCQYKTGKTLGSGTYAVVKECVKISDGKFYACKVISKKLMEGRETMIRNEITVLKSVSQGHPNVVTLWDYFETQNNLYLVTDLCLGGELFDRICAKGNYFEKDAAALIRVVVSAVDYLHSKGIVHRDLKPENLLFRNKKEDSDLLVADFGLSKMVEDETFSALTTTCGTPGYMAPEVFKKTGHGKPVDMWSIGVITYFLLVGYTPFDRESQLDEVRAICSADFKFEPVEYWAGVSDTAREFVRACLTVSPTDRITAGQALLHPFLTSSISSPPSSISPGGGDLLPTIKARFDARKTFKSAILKVKAAQAFATSGERHREATERELELLEMVRKGVEGADLESMDVDTVLA